MKERDGSVWPDGAAVAVATRPLGCAKSVGMGSILCGAAMTLFRLLAMSWMPGHLHRFNHRVRDVPFQGQTLEMTR